ncbi:hypothetical protein ACU6ZY_20920 [Klebsiella aerogenes]
MEIDYKALCISKDEIPHMRAMAYHALGESVVFLMSNRKKINKENLLKTLINEIEKQQEDTHRAYRLALEMLALYGW